MRPWAAECWPSSGDSCPDHQSSRPCASAPGPHWTSCPWWPSSPCPRCCPSRQRNLRPEESYAQEPRWKPTGPDIVILKYSEFVLTDLFVFLRLLLSKLIGLKSFLSGEGEGWFLQRHDLHWYFVLPVLTSVSKLRADPWKIQSYHELWRPQCWTTWLQGNYLLEIFWTKYLFQSVQRERERAVRVVRWEKGDISTYIDPSLSDKQNRSNADKVEDDRKHETSHNSERLFLKASNGRQCEVLAVTCSPSDNLIQTELLRTWRATNCDGTFSPL